MVNVSSHQSSRPVRGVRANAVALGVDRQRPARRAAGAAPAVAEELGILHPLGRAEEVAAVVAHLLSDDASFVGGAVVPVRGRRAVLGHDPEAV